MGHREKIRGGAEQDAFNRGWRRYYCYLSRPGVIRSLKRQFWKRQRAQWRDWRSNPTD